MTTGRLQSGVNTLQGFKEDKRNRVTPGEAPTCWRELGREAVLLLVVSFTDFLDGISTIEMHHQLGEKLEIGC